MAKGFGTATKGHLGYVCTKCKWQDLSKQRHDIQHRDTQGKRLISDTQHNGTRHNVTHQKETWHKYTALGH